MIDSENNSANTEDYIIILTTIASNQKAEQIASKLVKLNLAACIQIDKVRSIYFWKNDICKSSEYRLMIKTISTNYQNIENVIRQLSDYDNPQIIQLKMSAGSNEYLNWISKSCKKQNQQTTFSKILRKKNTMIAGLFNGKVIAHFLFDV